jgi:hypothetical protein
MLLGTWRRWLNQNVQKYSKKWVSFLLRRKIDWLNLHHYISFFASPE